MIVNASEWWHKIVAYYMIHKDYHFQDDPNLTFQEYVLISYLRPHGDGEVDLDVLNDADKNKWMIRDWKDECLAHYFQPVVIDKPWDKVLNDKKDVKIILEKDENGYYIGWKRKKPYKEWYEKEKKLEEQDFKNSINEWEEKKAIQKEYQRSRREKKKAEKENKNGK